MEKQERAGIERGGETGAQAAEGKVCLAGRILLLIGFANVLWFLLAARSAVLWGDSFTYVSFARTLARGHFYADGPVAEAVLAHHDGRLAVQGPIWNLGILPSGRMVFTVAPGFPLFLAAMYKLGGAWLMLHANVLLLAIVMGIFFLTIWEGWGRSRTGFLIAAIACLLMPRFNLGTFYQFSYPWREPLSYACLVFTCYVFVRYIKDGRAIWLFGAALLMGFACAVKESNVIYLPWLGVLALFSSSFRRQRGKWRVILVAGAAFLAGLSPLLAQNWLATGNPLLGIQTLRETEHFSFSGDPVAGLSTGNALAILAAYIQIYARNPWFAWPLLLLAAWGAIRAWREPIGRLLAGFLLTHILFYAQWGNAELRHMFWINIPYSFFLAAGALDIVTRLGSLWNPAQRLVPSLGLAGLAALAAWPVAPLARRGRDSLQQFNYTAARGFIRELEREVPANSLLLVNRALRDIIAAYSDRRVVRLQDLRNAREDRDASGVLKGLLDSGGKVFFLDNVDRDPRNYGRINFTGVDYRALRESFNLLPIRNFRREDHHLGLILDQSTLRLFEVAPWSDTRVHLTMKAPDDGAAFLFVNSGRASSYLQLRVNGANIPVPPLSPWYAPLPQPVEPGGDVAVEFDGNGRLIPGFLDTRLIGWMEPIVAGFGADTPWNDEVFFSEGLSDQPDASARYFDSRVPLRIPFRCRQDLFSLVTLHAAILPGLGTDPDESFQYRIYLRKEGREAEEIKESRHGVRFPLLGDPHHPGGGHEEVELFTEPAGWIKLHQIRVESCLRRFCHVPSTNAVGFILKGRMTPDRMGTLPRRWSAWVNGKRMAGGWMGSNPAHAHNRLTLAVPTRRGVREYCVELEGAGLLNPRVFETGPQLKIALGEDSKAFMISGFHAQEREGSDLFVWTRGRSLFKVPVQAGAQSYALRITGRNGHPLKARALTVRFDDSQVEVALPEDKAQVALELTSTNRPDSALADLRLEIEPWIPRVELNSSDTRELGFQFYELAWEPAHDR